MKAETYPSCNHEVLIRKILSSCKVRLRLRCLELDEKGLEEVQYVLRRHIPPQRGKECFRNPYELAI
jgi:hypothetical protein